MASSVTVAWGVECGIITVRDLAQKHRPPLPSEFLASFVVFGLLGVLAIPAPKAAAVAGWGLVVATFLSSQIDFLGPVGDFMSGKFGLPGTLPVAPPATAVTPPDTPQYQG